MKALILRHDGDHPQGLAFADIPVPIAAPGQVLIKNSAIDINPIDNKTLQGRGQFGRIKSDKPVILGWGVSGEVAQVGSGVYDLRKGDAVFGLINFPGHGKTYAQFTTAPAEQLALKPANITHEQAAASTLAALTAYQAIQLVGLRAGERVYVQGAAGGVGFFLLQIAKHLGAWVAGSGSPKDETLLRKAGLDLFIDYHTEDFRTAIADIDLAFDIQGGESAIKTLDVIKSGGNLVTFPTTAEQPWKAIAAERGIHAQHMLVRSSGEDMLVLAGWLSKGLMLPNISARFGFDELILVHEQITAGALNGKIVITV